MNFPVVLFAIKCHIADTRAQARSAGLSLGFLIATFACIAFCLSIGVCGETPQLETRPWEATELIPRAEADRLKIDPDYVRSEGVDVPTGELTLFFGLVRVPLHRHCNQAVRLIQVILAGGLADTVGILLALIWTASFLAGLLEPGTASVLLAKPTSRGTLMLGKLGGILAVVTFQATLFVALTWLALGWRTGTWDVRYFLAIPVLVVHFAVFLSVSALLAIWFRSPVACALGTTLFWVMCFGINMARQEAAAVAADSTITPMLQGAYWIAPKPLDYNLMLADMLHADEYFGSIVDVHQLEARGVWMPELSLASGLAFAAAILSAAGWRLNRVDY